MSPLADASAAPSRRDRSLLFACWLALALWFVANHVVWRDEVRAFSLALSGSNIIEMLQNVHGEGHPAIWYLALRAAHEIFPYREVLPVMGALFGIGAMALFAFRSPFRLVVIAIVLFSFYAAFEYVAVARNYGMSLLVMFGLATLYPRIKESLWLGVALAILCNTNVPSCFLAAGFLLFRFVELWTGEERPGRSQWSVFAGVAALALAGAMLCFVTVYPTFNDAAVSPNLNELGPTRLLAALFDPSRGFTHLFVGSWIIVLSWLAYAHRPAALAASVASFLGLKLFFYFVYISYYRHEALYIGFLLALFWMTAEGAGGRWRTRPTMPIAQAFGAWSLSGLLLMQTVSLIIPIRETYQGVPLSHSADVGRLLQQPALRSAIVMADPDTMLESLPYFVDNPLWMLRQQRFGKVVRLSRDARHHLTLDDILADAQRLHARTGRPIVFLGHLPFQTSKAVRWSVMFGDTTTHTPASVRRFRASTRLVASFRQAGMGDEKYEVYVYPR